MSNPYVIEVMITYLIEMLQLTNLQNNLTHVVKFLGGVMMSESFISKYSYFKEC